MSKVCSIDGCGRPAHTRGWCNRHYQRWWSSGNPLGKHKGMNGDTIKYIEEVAKDYKGDDCLIWPYSRLPSGYAVIRIKSKLFYVHRLICERASGVYFDIDNHEVAHSSSDVLFIRKSNDIGILLAERFGVSKSLIYAIKQNKVWKWLT